MTKVVAKVRPLTQSQKYFMTAAFLLISLMYFLVVWHWSMHGLQTPESSQIKEITTQIYENKTLTAPVTNPILYQVGEYTPKTEYFFQNPLHYIAILVTASLFGALNVQVFGTLFITMSIIFLTWKLAEELALHLDTRGDESLFFVKVLVWITSLAFFSTYWTPWFSPELLYSMLVIAAVYNMFRFYRLRSYPDAAIGIIWLVFSLVISTQALVIGVFFWVIWIIQFILLSRQSKVIRRTIFLISISAIVVGSYWLHLMQNYQIGVDLGQSTGVVVSVISEQFSETETQNILSQVEGNKGKSNQEGLRYIRYSLLSLIALGSVYIFYQRRSAGFFLAIAIVGGLIGANSTQLSDIEKMSFLAPYVVFLAATVSLRVFRRVPEGYRFALSGFFLSVVFLFLFTTPEKYNSISSESLQPVIDELREVEEGRKVMFSKYTLPEVTTIYDERFSSIDSIEDRIVVWDSLYQANFWLIKRDQMNEVEKELLKSDYFEEVTRTDDMILYQRTINYSR